MAEPEYLEEMFRGSIEEGAAKFLGSTGDFNQITFDELSKYFARLHAANRFDIGSQHGLSVGHNRQGFHGGGGQPNLRGSGV